MLYQGILTQGLLLLDAVTSLMYSSVTCRMRDFQGTLFVNASHLCDNLFPSYSARFSAPSYQYLPLHYIQHPRLQVSAYLQARATTGRGLSAPLSAYSLHSSAYHIRLQHFPSSTARQHSASTITHSKLPPHRARQLSWLSETQLLLSIRTMTPPKYTEPPQLSSPPVGSYRCLLVVALRSA